MEPETIFLNSDQAAATICRDLRQYEPQTVLMCEILRVLNGPEAVKRDGNGIHIRVGPDGHGRLRRLSPAELVEHVCSQIIAAKPSMETLASICRRVFQAVVHPIKPGDGKPEGLAIETAMKDFACIQCGLCCRALNYRHGVTAADVARWRDMGREDILAWVRGFRLRDGTENFTIWVVPGTNRFAETCPFLKQGASSHLWVCAIHDVKPAVCRQYPITRKHAVMTGCRGFDEAGNRAARTRRE